MLTYNGTNLLTAVSGLSITDISGRGPISQDIETISVPGQAGAYFVQKNIPVRTIAVSIELTGLTLADIRAKVDTLNSYLKVDGPKSMVFNDESNRMYYGILSGNQDWNEVLFTGKGTLNFLCPDPFKYSSTTSSASYTSNETATITVNGNEPTEPVTTINVSADTTYISIYNSTTDKMNLLGMPTKATETAAAKDTIILNETGNSGTGWAAPASTEDGTVSGTMTTPIDFVPNPYGTGTDWHGPAFKKTLSSTAQDFRVDCIFSMVKAAKTQCGSVVLSILDGQNAVLAKMKMTKHFPNVDACYFTIQVGKNTVGNGKILIADKEFKGGSFTGFFRVRRIGTLWIFQLFKSNSTGGFNEIKLGTAAKYNDTNNYGSALATQAQIQILQRAAYTPLNQKVMNIVVWKYNTLTSTQVPYVANAGDVVVFDHKNNIITVNGVDVSDQKAFIGDYWDLVPGSNTIVVEPYDVFTSVSTSWQDKWQ
jgi:predicted phage tail component-like protein